MTIDPENWEVALAAIFLILNAALSLALNLGFVRQMTIAAVRMVIQLSLIGLVLDVILTSKSAGLTALVACVMVGVAGYEVMARQEAPLKGIWGYGLGTGTMLFGAALVMMFALNVTIQPEPWYDPRYAIPMFGMMLGNAMTGIAVGLNALSTDLISRRAAVEAHLLTGATRWEALAPTMRRAANAGLIPIINAMAATGVVSLPGMMTGQILAGADPAQAVRYQLLVMFLITGATGIGLVIAIFGAALRLTDNRHRIRLDRLKRD
ncbi:ABC transporter permease [Minwuia sp.]|uniref:ABC transporter permease n=1 Tax=Minwuia sp. TaxID=2493630 RepID=UPI003A9105A7